MSSPTQPGLRCTQSNTELAEFIHMIFGVFIWDFANTFRVEIDWRNLLHWVNGIYLLCRYSLLLFCLGLILAVSSYDINQQAVLLLVSWAEVSVITSSTTILVLRVSAVWKARRRVLFPLLVLSAAQWAVSYCTLTLRKLWLEGSNEQLDPHFCQEAILISTNIYTTLFHAGLLISVICGSRMVGTFDESLSGFIKGDCCYFVLVLLASTTNLVLGFICVTRQIHQGLRIAACMTAGLASCRIFRRFDSHHRPKLNDEAAPIVAATRRLANKPSVIALRHASSRMASRPSTARQGSTVGEVESEQLRRESGLCYELDSETKIEPLGASPTELCARSLYSSV